MKTGILSTWLLVLSLAIISDTHAQQSLPLASRVVAIDDLNDAHDSDKQQCSENKDTMLECRSFIKGFLQGALLTDTAIIDSIESMEPTFAERAMRTRLGKRPRVATALAGFCLPADRTILAIAEETLDHVKTSERNSAELAKNVFNSLKTDYPCS